ncbi:MAG: hypothetical protein ABI665_22760 [Vicinamibacterales bacterium]
MALAPGTRLGAYNTIWTMNLTFSKRLLAVLSPDTGDSSPQAFSPINVVFN